MTLSSSTSINDKVNVDLCVYSFKMNQYIQPLKAKCGKAQQPNPKKNKSINLTLQNNRQMA